MTAFAPIQHDLPSIRATLVARIDEAMVAAQRLASPDVSIPVSLLRASMWLVDQGYVAEPCEGERYFVWPPQDVEKFLSRLSRPAREDEVRRGYKVLFVGNSRRPALVAAVGERLAA
jgi:hypothetical protein